jgi:hypothetical protein
MEGPLARGFEAASRFFGQAVQVIPDHAWDERGLGTWSVRELVGHANRAHTTIEEYLRQPQPPEPAGSRYFSPEAIAERGRQAVAALGDDPKAAVAVACQRAVRLIAGTSAHATIGSPAGTMILGAYLPSRTAELTIHGLDIVRALGVELAAPDEALLESFRFLAGHIMRRGNGEVALLALSGRTALPPGFSAY